MKKDVNQKLQKAFNKIETPDVLNSVLSDCKYEQGYEIVNKKQNHWIKGLSFALMILLVSVIGFNTLFGSRFVMTTIAFDVNPSIELEINKKEEIIKVNAMNEDAQKILDGMDLEGVDLDVAVNALIGSMIKQGYLSNLANSILVSVDSKDQETVDRLQKELMNEISLFISENNLDGAIITQKINVEDKEIQALAKQYNITKAKAQLIKEILKTNHYHTFEDLVDLTINELNLISESQKDLMTNVTSKGSASEEKYIGKEKALEIALKNANTNDSNVNELEIEIDYEMNKMIYEIEFELNGLEYDYDIDATSGTILHVQKEKTESNDDSFIDSSNPTYISKNKVKEIVFNHASINENQINGLWIELDSDDGIVIYEIEFNVDNVEYSYEVNANTGAILDFEKEIDD